MQLEGFSHERPEAPIHDGGRERRRRLPPGNAARRVLRGNKTAPVRRPAANLLRHGCAKVAERIRASTGVTAGEAGPKQRAATAMPWLGLLLWALACAGLFVSLMMRPDNVDRDRRVAARSEAKASISAPANPMRAVMQAHEISLIGARRPPAH
jgi:hypothetical protein